MVGVDVSAVRREARPARARVLVVEDEERLARLVAELLTREGYDVDTAHDGQQGLHAWITGRHDLVLLDLMLPTLSGDRVLARARTAGFDTPVIMLTARDEDHIEVEALHRGADDYVRKPFSSAALLARVAALLRRTQPAGVLSSGAVSVDTAARRVHVADREVDLSAREFDLLAHLVARRGAVVSKSELLDEVWDEPYADPNLVEACMVGLRRKLGVAAIETVRGVGYRIRVEPS